MDSCEKAVGGGKKAAQKRSGTVTSIQISHQDRLKVDAMLRDGLADNTSDLVRFAIRNLFALRNQVHIVQEAPKTTPRQAAQLLAQRGGAFATERTPKALPAGPLTVDSGGTATFVDIEQGPRKVE